MEYADKADGITNTYSISRLTLKWTKKLFFHLLNLFNSEHSYSAHILWFQIQFYRYVRFSWKRL
jgi:hypothetical protein